MKWTYSIQNKMAASGALFTLCALVLFSNYMNQQHTNNVKSSISTLYEDRLVVEDYIRKMTIDVYEIKQALYGEGHERDPSHTVAALFSNIDQLSEAYRKTKFTRKEDTTFAELTKTLKEFENTSSNNTQDKLHLANQALAQLNDLSTIQLDESKLIMRQAESLYKSSQSASQLAFAIVIIILLVLQALVFASKSLSDVNPPPGRHLN